jgi:Domain of unknown function (DUF4340)
MNRQNQILSIILVIQLALAAFIFWPRHATTAGGALFAGLDADKITRLTISDATGQQIQLAKGASGWVLPQASDYPTLADKVPNLLKAIAAIKTDRLIAQTSASHKQLKVSDQDFERLIELESSDGAHYKLYLGTSAGYQDTHVRADGQDQVYLASGLSVSDAAVQASGWIDTKYFSVPQDQIVALTVENKNGRLEFEKDATGAWTMKGLSAGETANATSITSLASRLATVTMLQPLGKTEQDAYGLKSPSAVVTIKTRDQGGTEKTAILLVGAQDAADNSFVVIYSESPYYVKVNSSSVQDFVNKARADFLQLPPTPAPAATP